MHCRFSLLRTLLLLVLASHWFTSAAQNASNGSPYSAYGFGDLLPANQVPSALMGGVGVAVTEPYSIFSSNPASYAASRQPELGGLQRPVFEGGVRGVFQNARTQETSVSRSDGQFMGFSVGVPFGKGRWGLGLGISPYSDVGYSLIDEQPFVGGTVNYEYKGSGGLNRVFAGVGHVLWQQRADTLGDLGSRLTVGANFEYYFGGIEQSRKAVYPRGQGYVNTSAFSSLVLSAPTANFGLQFSSQVISKASVAANIKRREERRREKDRVWREAHAGIAGRERSAARDPEPWRYVLGLVGELPTELKATNTALNTTFVRGSTGSEAVIDTLPSSLTTTGTLTLPIAYGFGVSIQDQRFMFTAEVKRRDWTALRTNVEGFSLPAPLRASSTFSFGARYTPSKEGGLFQRMTYRTGVRYSQDYLQVRDTQLLTTSVSLGASIPLNAAQTNSYLHIGGELGQRGTKASGLLQENFVNVWVGVSITPWRGERWFKPYQIQ
jgi:hypothetical protein